MKRSEGSTAEWQEIARRPNVLHNILTWPDRDSWEEDEFYATGEADWVDFRHHWRHHWPELGGTCVEIGCGAGRMTRALAGDFERVVGLDVSLDMLERARAVVPANVELCQAGAEAGMPLEDGEADGVFAVHVLQHLDSYEAMAAQLAEAKRVLRPGGGLMVHIPLQSKRPSLLRRALMEARIRRSRRALRRGGEFTVVRMRIYQMERLERLLDELGFVDVELRVFPVRSNTALHHFWLGRAA